MRSDERERARQRNDYDGGDPMPAGGVEFDGGTAAAGGDALQLLGRADAADAVTFAVASVSMSGTGGNVTHTNLDAAAKSPGWKWIARVRCNLALLVVAMYYSVLQKTLTVVWGRRRET